MTVGPRPVRFLASVTSPEEAVLAVEGGADIIDAKDPSQGALGALDPGIVSAIRAAVPRAIPVSATIGDLPSDPDRMIQAVLDMAAAGADMIKVGFFPGGDAAESVAALGALRLGGRRLVGLLLADLAPDFGLIAEMRRASFSTVMLDTADKARGSLTAVLGPRDLADFIATAHAAGLTAGLAGSLRRADVPRLLKLGPDILGFRGALCEAGSRNGRLDRQSVALVRAAIPAAGTRGADELVAAGRHP